MGKSVSIFKSIKHPVVVNEEREVKHFPSMEKGAGLKPGISGLQESAYEPSAPSGRRFFSSFCSMKRLGVFLLPPGWDASPSHGYPSIKFAGAHLYTWLERGTVGVKCLAQEHNTMSPFRARTRTIRSGGERTNHEGTAPPQHFKSSTI